VPKPIHIEVPQPVAGCKAFLLDKIGVFILERGPGTLITSAITHAGAGSLMILEGIPDENGFFPEPPPKPQAGDNPEAFNEWGKRNGREYFRANPVVMGSWMLNAGFHHGLTVWASGGHESMAPVATIVWQPYRVRNA
jgi:hypothetical protein